MTDYTNTFTEGTGDTIDTTDFSTEFTAIETAIATKADTDGDTLTNLTIGSGYSGGAIKEQAQVAVTSGTSVDIDLAVPSWVRDISIFGHKLSTAANATVYIQVGAGSFSTAGYEGTIMRIGGGGTISTNATSGYHCLYNCTAADENNFDMSLRKLSTTNNIWVASCVATPSATGVTDLSWISTGRIATGGTLDRIRIVSNSAFDGANGLVGVIYKG